MGVALYGAITAALTSQLLARLQAKVPAREHSDHGTSDIFAQIRKLGELWREDLLTDEEYNAKKAELLRRL